MISDYPLPKEIGLYKSGSFKDGTYSRLVYTKDNSFVLPRTFKNNELETTAFKEYLQDYSQNVKYEVGS